MYPTASAWCRTQTSVPPYVPLQVGHTLAWQTLVSQRRQTNKKIHLPNLYKSLASLRSGDPLFRISSQQYFG